MNLTRIVPKHYDGEDYRLLSSLDNSEANIWSLESRDSIDSLWRVVADFYSLGAVKDYLAMYDYDEVLTVAFIVSGAETAKYYNDATAKLGMGCVEMTDALLPFGKVVEQVWKDEYIATGKSDDISFVWEYDVSSQIGIEVINFAERFGHLPNEEWVKEKAIALAAEGAMK